MIAAVTSGRPIAPAFALQSAPKLKLVDTAGKPLKAGALEVHANYIFRYPYVSTPCLLLRLDKATEHDVVLKDADNAAYTWPGGVGKDRAVVAYSAICSHTYSSDRTKSSFLTYSQNRNLLTGHSRVITCCAHASIFDPADAAKVISGPATLPLAAVQLEYDAATDEMTAVGLVGTQLLDEFFRAQREDLNAEFGRGGYRVLLEGQTTVLPIGEYSKDVIRC
jgi:Rieske Fe-S protein